MILALFGSIKFFTYLLTGIVVVVVVMLKIYIRTKNEESGEDTDQ